MSKNVVDMTLRANMDLSNITSDISQIQNYLKKISLSPETKRSFDNLFDEATSDLEKIQKRIDKGFKTKGDVIGFEKAASGIDATFKKIENKLFKLYNLSDKEIFKLDPKLKGDIEAIERKFANIAEDFPKDIKNGLKSVSGEIDKLKTTSQKKAGKEILSKIDSKDYEGALKLAQQKLKKQQAVAKSNPAADKTTGPQIKAYKNIVSVLQEAISHIDKFNNKAKYLEAEKAERVAQTFNTVKDNISKAQEAAEKASKGFGQVSTGIKDAAQETVNFNSELDSIKQRVSYFFSLTNSVMLFRRILQDTINTTKELDAAMTETAVVTDFSVADMWKDLPRYTNIAKELGTTIKGVYETMTLYYQQGLKTEEVVEVGTETLKMARIAGLDYAKATDFMTAALRGFNMEVNEINAQKVNDVYSELAAITAADTQEIATAMTKTASIASSANMEFETTAAFLSQIIETTRESAETAGTALKTVIARFTELKKDPAEIGEVDGEIVDANKIETALRTIDVALRDTSGQFRELDDVFLDISAKWAGLDTNTQRYIATMAAGSRQQSRFIAMMSDYSRTMELVNAANNSAGASQKQFDKTLESLEAKLNQLKDAWDQFTMGIANNTLIKTGVDALTGFINLLNKMTEHLPGPTKGIGNLLLLIGGFKAADKIFKAFSNSILADLTAVSKGAIKAGEHVGDSFFDALKKEFKRKRKLGIANFFKNDSKDVESAVERINKQLTNIELPKLDSKKMMLDEDYVKEMSDAYNKAKAAQDKLTEAKEKAQKVQKAMNDFTSLGVEKEVAASMAKRGLTLEEIKASAAKKLNKEAVEDLTEEEIQQLLIEEMTSGELTKNNLLIGLRKLAVDQETGATKTNTTAKIANWIITKILNKEWLKLALAIAGVVAVVAIVVGSFKLLSNLIETNSEKLQRFSKAAEYTSESMSEAKDTIEDIKTSMEDLGNLDTELDGLVKGTDAWKEKLAEINNEVIELIKKYPTLAQYVEKGAQGELTIKSEGWNEVLEQQQKALSSATLANFTSQAQKTQAENKNRLEELVKNSSFYGLVDPTRIIAAAKEYSKQDKFLTSGQTDDVLKDNYLQEVLNQYAASGDVAIAEFNELISAVKASELQLENYANSVTDSLLRQNDLINDSEYKDSIAKLISSELKIGENGQISSEIEQVLDKKYGNYGKDGQHYNLDKTAIWKDYANLKGKTYQEVKEESKDDDDLIYSMALELASQEAAEKLTDGAELLVKGLNKIGLTFLKTDKQLSNSFKALFTDKLTQQDIENLKTNQPQFSELPQEIKEYFDNNSLKYQEFINEQIKLAEEQLVSAGEVLANLPADELDISKISAGAMKGLALELQEVFYKSGEEGVKAITESYNAIVGSLDKEQAEKFTSALNGIDWLSVTSINDLKNTLYDMGVYIDDSKLKELTEDITEFNKATQAVSLDQLVSQLESSQSLIEEISDRESGDRSFTEEEKEALIDAGANADSFVGYGDSWQYVGSSLDELITALQENTQAIIGDSTDQLEQKLNLAQASTRIQNEGNYDLANYGVLGVSDKQQLLGNFIKESGLQTIAGYDTKALGNLTNTNITLDTYQENILNQILETIANSIGTEDSVSAELESYKKQSAIVGYNGVSTTQVLADATSEDPIASENATNTLLYRAAAYEELNDEIREYNEAIKSEDKQLANNIKKELGAKIAIQERAEALDDLDDKVETHLQNLDEIEKGTHAYENAIGSLTEDLNAAFDTDLTSDFFENTPENLDLLEDALEGSQIAWDSLILKIQSAQVATIDFENEYGIAGVNISTITDALDNLSFDIDGNADMTQVVQSLLAAGMTGQEVADFLEKLGYTNIEFKVEGSDLDLTDIKNPEDLKDLSWSLTATNVNIPAAREYSSFGDYGANSGTKTGDSDSSGNNWENPYDSFYNINEDINNLIRERNDLEREYEKILQDENAIVDDYYNNYMARLKNYNQELGKQKGILSSREQDQKRILSDYSHLSNYAWIEDGKIQINYEAINSVTDEDTGDEIEEYIDALEDNIDAIDEAEEAIDSAETAIQDLIDSWKETAADFEREIYDALVEAREKDIEEIESISDTLDEAASNLVSAIQEEINERRQERDNKETEEDILDKEKRLAFLQQDTSGAYDQEILELQKELTEQKEDYTDTLIDQKISNLEKQNEEAAKQRERQIKIAQTQLQYDKENGVIAKETRAILEKANSAEGQEELWNTLFKTNEFKTMTLFEQEMAEEKMRTSLKETLSFLKASGDGSLAEVLSESNKDIVSQVLNNTSSKKDSTKKGNSTVDTPDYTGKTPEELEAEQTAALKKKTKEKLQDYIKSHNMLESDKNRWGQDSEFKKLFDEYLELGGSLKDLKGVTPKAQPKTVTDTKYDMNGIEYYKIGSLWYKKSDISDYNQKKNTAILKSGADGQRSIFVDGGETTGKKITTFLTQKQANDYIERKVKSEKINGKQYYLYDGFYYTASPLTTDDHWYGTDIVLMEGYKKYKKYKTGGLADYTGPAWLDGTKSKPELVLNQVDTKNFLALKDVLGDFMKNNSSIENTNNQSGDTNFEISISVEKMTSDYDVEQVANKIKQMISSDASYRNSNLISRLR